MWLPLGRATTPGAPDNHRNPTLFFSSFQPRCAHDGGTQAKYTLPTVHFLCDIQLN